MKKRKIVIWQEQDPDLGDVIRIAGEGRYGRVLRVISSGERTEEDVEEEREQAETVAEAEDVDEAVGVWYRIEIEDMGPVEGGSGGVDWDFEDD